MSLLDIVEAKYGGQGQGAKGAKGAKSHLKALKALKAPRPKRQKSQDIDAIVSVDTLRRQLLRERRSELQTLAADEWGEIAADIPKVIAFANMEAIRQIRESGNCPDTYTAITECKHCGPVPIWPGCPPQVISCPWCLNGQKVTANE